jgi:predicted ArsR family transcriptional regulator
LIRREAGRRTGKGRPGGVYRLTGSAEAFFPNRESHILLALVRYLEEVGREDLVGGFFQFWAGHRQPALEERLRGLRGDERLEELARALTEEGFMAEVGRTEDGRPVLRLCNCPLERLVTATVEPCRWEMRLVREMIGDPLTRIEYKPSGDDSCSYAVAAKP